MKFESIITLSGFEFFELKQADYYELWIMNKELTIMKYVYGSKFKIMQDEVKRLYAKNYFDSYIYDYRFTDQED